MKYLFLQMITTTQNKREKLKLRPNDLNGILSVNEDTISTGLQLQNRHRRFHQEMYHEKWSM